MKNQHRPNISIHLQCQFCILAQLINPTQGAIWNSETLEKEVTVTANTQFVLITTNTGENIDIKKFPIVIAASINKKPVKRTGNKFIIDADWVNYESYYTFNDYPYQQIDLQDSGILSGFPSTIYVTFYNFGPESVPPLPFESLDFNPTLEVKNANDTTCINGCNQQSSNGNICTRGVCTCNTGYSGADCWMNGGKEFTESLTGFDSIWLEPGASKGFWVKTSDISDFKYCVFLVKYSSFSKIPFFNKIDF